MATTIVNGSNIPLYNQDTSVPDCTGALQNYYQQLIYTTLIKTVVNFQLVETPTTVHFWGVVMPLSGRDLMIKPEGQRQWNWITIYSQTPINLKPDDVITFQSVQYRVMARKTFQLYSYLYFELVEDYTGSGGPFT